ncbi:extracellular solute-binding protein [Candidatus Aerophobetes bacterium]|uniref:Extracellular solute-binding protein n=1 Tax=Aerophobetes bacterium TaxID=2030807 RepID=A0A523UMF5_UNCAE|nr:MAG: extracellular solute-binding protein [Candidatus Aerophobetes bacterium]
MRRRDKLAFKLKVVIGTLLIGAIGFCLLSVSLAAKEKIIYMSTPWGVPSKNLLAEFEKQTGIEVEVTTIGDEKALRDKVMIATAGGIAPADVIFVGITNVGVFSSSKSIAQLDEIVSPDLLEELTSADLFRIGGYLYSVPIYQQLVMIDYDSSVLEKMGAPVPTTWEEFTQLCREIKQKGIRKYPITFGARAWSWYLIALSMGGVLFDEELNPTFHQPDSGGLGAMKLLRDFFEEELISAERITSVNPHPSFWAGEAVFHQAWQGSLTIANDPEKSKIAPNAKYILLPDEHFTWSLPAALGISAFSNKKDEAYKFIVWFTKAEIQKSLYEAYGMFPANKAAFAALGEADEIEGFDVMAEQARFVRRIPYRAPWYTEFENEANDTIKRMVRDQISPEEAVGHLANYVYELKKEYE